MNREAVFTNAERTAVQAYVAALLAKAPPLTNQQRDRLGLLLRRTGSAKAA